MKKTTKASKKNATKKNNKLVIPCVIFSLIAVLVAGIFLGYNSYMYGQLSDINTETNFEDQLFMNAEDGYNDPWVSMDYSIRLKEVYLNTLETGELYYHFEISNYAPQGFMIGEMQGDDSKYENVHSTMTLKEFSKRHELMIESARNFVIEFINDSSVLTDKENLIEKINAVPFYLYTDSTHDIVGDLDSPAVHTGNAIYCNNEYKKYFCEFMYVHELIHHLRYLTLGESLSNVTYFATQFDETMTDLITNSMNPKIFKSNVYRNGYEDTYSVMNEYLYLFGEEALRAYFYGYEDFYASRTSTFATEHEAFIVALEKYSEGIEGAIVACETLIQYWDSQSAT